MKKTCPGCGVEEGQSHKEGCKHPRPDFKKVFNDSKLFPSPSISSDEKPDPFGTIPERNWEEDYAHENGHYINTCFECKLYFMGHKRRVICKKCSEPNWAEIAEKQPPSDNKCAHAGCWAEGEMVGYARCMVNKFSPLQKELSELKEAKKFIRETLIKLNEVLMDDLRSKNEEIQSLKSELTEAKELMSQLMLCCETSGKVVNGFKVNEIIKGIEYFLNKSQSNQNTENE